MSRRTVPLYAITGLSPRNVHGAVAGDDVAELAASITAIGLIQP